MVGVADGGTGGVLVRVFVGAWVGGGDVFGGFVVAVGAALVGAFVGVFDGGWVAVAGPGVRLGVRVRVMVGVLEGVGDRVNNVVLRVQLPQFGNENVRVAP